MAGEFGMLSTVMQGLGGIFQIGQLEAAANRRMFEMRRQAAKEIGRATAIAGASGVEMTSSTIQGHLQSMQQEWKRRENQMFEASDASKVLTAIQTGGNMLSTFGQSMSGAAGALENIGEGQGPAPIPGPTQKNPLNFYWLGE